MKKIIIILTFGSLLFGATTVELTCDKGYPPYSYKEDKITKGVYVDVIKSAFSKMPDYDVKFKPLAWKKAGSLVKKGKAVGFFPPYYNESKTAWTNFSEPILGETAVVFALAKTLETRKNFPQDYKGLTLCMNRGFAVENFGNVKFKEMLDKKEIKLKWGNDNKVCLRQVAKKKADFYLNDQLIDTKAFLNIKRGVATKNNDGYIGFTLKEKKFPYLKDLQTKFNKVIRDMKASGEIDKILKSYQ